MVTLRIRPATLRRCGVGLLGVRLLRMHFPTKPAGDGWIRFHMFRSREGFELSWVWCCGGKRMAVWNGACLRPPAWGVVGMLLAGPAYPPARCPRRGCQISSRGQLRGVVKSGEMGGTAAAVVTGGPLTMGSCAAMPTEGNLDIPQFII